jgi:hypothetical protein
MKLTMMAAFGIAMLTWPCSFTAATPHHRTAPSWVELFNARDLSEWHKLGGGKAFVKDGLLILEHDAERRPGYLVSDFAPVRDFQAIVVCRVPTGDSGFFFRGEPHPLHATEFRGPQVQLNMQPGRGLGGIFELHGRSWVCKPDVATEARIREGADWITCELTVKGPRIQVRINGVPTVDITDAGADNHFQEAGRFALQIHGGGYCRAEFRRIAVRRLD